MARDVTIGQELADISNGSSLSLDFDCEFKYDQYIENERVDSIKVRVSVESDDRERKARSRERERKRAATRCSPFPFSIAPPFLLPCHHIPHPRCPEYKWWTTCQGPNSEGRSREGSPE